jgi:hypothetical protein
MAHTPESQDWRSIAAQASKEMDDDKLLLLVEQLCSAFDERHEPHQSEYDQNRYALENVSQDHANFIFLKKSTANH